eukprot:TRINITY_DN103207_c0_g1_i1.p1 TRINITY_DN103207_c0_g1~~TRINITY_DN103207_c0_g1_i1.p1  ORF type:complete len:128 (-),score=0.50 TRINITY_DN103207_c0_g1_i1:94-477(-)
MYGYYSTWFTGTHYVWLLLNMVHRNTLCMVITRYGSQEHTMYGYYSTWFTGTHYVWLLLDMVHRNTLCMVITQHGSQEHTMYGCYSIWFTATHVTLPLASCVEWTPLENKHKYTIWNTGEVWSQLTD